MVSFYIEVESEKGCFIMVISNE